MRLYLSADIEGTCGIADWAETERATMDDYRPFAAQMTAEVAAACRSTLGRSTGSVRRGVPVPAACSISLCHLFRVFNVVSL